MNQRKLETRPHDDNTRLIPLTQGQFAIVDEHDYRYLSKWKWYAQWNPKTRSFYAARTAPETDGVRVGTVWMHREVLGLKRNDHRQADHIRSGDTLNNRKSNLRTVTGFQNQQNRRIKHNSKSGFKGVSSQANVRGWKAEIRANGNRYYLGLYPTPEEAYTAYCEAARKFHGEFANLG